MSTAPFTPHAEVAARARQALVAPKGQAPTPCVKVCQMDRATGLCRGCWRTMREIATWQNLDDAAKRQVWRETVERSKAG